VALLADIEADYRRFTNTRSLRFNLAYAEGFEAFTTAFALFCHDQGWLKKLRPGARELFEWHMLEELEHRRVAFDVYREVSDNYWVRVVVNLFAQWHLQRFTFRAARALLAARPQSETQGVRARLRGLGRTLPHCWAAFRHLAPRALAMLLPSYTPHDIEMPRELRAAAARHTAWWATVHHF
jgi:predicted metal-dependent hydrolase